MEADDFGGDMHCGNRLIMTAFLLVFSAASDGEDAQAPLAAAKRVFENAYAAWDLAGFREAAARFEEVCEATPDSYPAQYWLGAARFHIVLHRNRADAPWSEVQGLMDAAETPLKRAAELNEEDAEANAMLATLAGMRIAENPLAAVWLGPRVMRHRRAAEKHGETNPRAQYLAGAGYLLSGRSREEKALEHLERALELFPAETAARRPEWAPAWGYDNCLAFAGQACRNLGQMGRARDYFEKALKVNPRNRLAREGLQATGTQPPKEREP